MTIQLNNNDRANENIKKTFSANLFKEVNWPTLPFKRNGQSLKKYETSLEYYYKNSLSTAFSNDLKKKESVHSIERVEKKVQRAHQAIETIVFDKWLDQFKTCKDCFSECSKSEQENVNPYPSSFDQLDLDKLPYQSIKVYFLAHRPESCKQDNSYDNEKWQLVRKMAKAMNLEKHEYLLGYALKCNESEDIRIERSNIEKKCIKHFNKEIMFCRPQVVITLGAIATNFLIGYGHKLSKVHGRFFEKLVTFDNDESHKINIMPIFHPEYLMINPQMKRTTWEDLKKVITFLKQKT